MSSEESLGAAAKVCRTIGRTLPVTTLANSAWDRRRLIFVKVPGPFDQISGATIETNLFVASHSISEHPQHAQEFVDVRDARFFRKQVDKVNP